MITNSGRKTVLLEVGTPPKMLSHDVIGVDFEIHPNKINGILDLQSANLQSRNYGLYIDNKELENGNCMEQIISFNNGIIYTSKNCHSRLIGTYHFKWCS